MTTQERYIIETILADVGLEPLCVEDKDNDYKKDQIEM